MLFKFLRNFWSNKIKKQLAVLDQKVEEDSQKVDALLDYQDALLAMEKQIDGYFDQISHQMILMTDFTMAKEAELDEIGSQLEEATRDLQSRFHINSKQKKGIKKKFDTYQKELNKIKSVFAQIELDIFSMENDLKDIIQQARAFDTANDSKENNKQIEELFNRFNEVMQRKNQFQEKINTLNMLGKSLD